MDEIHKEFEGRKVTVLAVNVFDEVEDAKRFAEATNYDFQWAFGDRAVTSRLGVASVPSVIVIDGDGNVAWRSSLWTTIRQGGDLRAALNRITES